MKSYTLRFQKINKGTFDLIKSGEKKVETRAASTKYTNVSVGNTVTFVCGTSRFTRIIKSAKKFKTLDAMLRAYKVQDIDPRMSSKQELQKAYDSYAGYKAKLKQFGFLALELE